MERKSMCVSGCDKYVRSASLRFGQETEAQVDADRPQILGDIVADATTDIELALIVL